MDLQKTKEALRDTHATHDEGSECPLEGYGEVGHSKISPKNDSSLEHHHDPHNNDSFAIVNTKCQSGRFPYLHGAPQRSPSPAQPNCRVVPLSPEIMDIPNRLDLGDNGHGLLMGAREQPTVTKETLRELDLPCIINNISLRMDANFDRDLHFKPALDGEKGKLKRREVDDYWDAMAAEISIYEHKAYHGLENCCGGPPDNANPRRTFTPRLPSMFKALQDVLKTLVPERDHPSIMQNLDVSLLMQQIRKGVLDMVGLAHWLAALLKTHCAPMRDEWADRMVQKITFGSQSQNPKEIVNGLKTLFCILEAMKLDVANHQIRAFRVLLVEDSIPFLQEYFQGEIARDRFPVESSRSWYLAQRDRGLHNMDRNLDSFWPVSVMFQGLSELLLQFDDPEGFPETFIYDSERLWRLRASLQNLINLEISWYIFESYVHTQKRYLSIPAELYSTFRSRIWSLMEENEDCRRESPRCPKNIRYIALEVARFACVACCGDDVVSDDAIVPIERALETHLSNASELFQYFRNSMQEKLLRDSFEFARRYLNMSPLAICESQRNFPQSPSQLEYDFERIAAKLAHIGVLHWRVWAPILYLCDNTSGEVETGQETPIEDRSLPSG